jgi:hypothetical protein
LSIARPRAYIQRQPSHQNQQQKQKQLSRALPQRRRNWTSCSPPQKPGLQSQIYEHRKASSAKQSERSPSPKSTKKIVAIAAAKVQKLDELLTAAQKGLQIAIADT